MNFLARKDIKRLEDKIKNGYSLPIFKGYVAVDKYGVEQIIDAIYANLPDDVMRAREFLKNSNITPNTTPKGTTIFDILQMLEITLNETMSFANFSILEIKEIEVLLDKIEKNIPEEIIQAEISNK